MRDNIRELYWFTNNYNNQTIVQEPKVLIFKLWKTHNILNDKKSNWSLLYGLLKSMTKWFFFLVMNLVKYLNKKENNLFIRRKLRTKRKKKIQCI